MKNLLERLSEAGGVGLDMSPGDPLAAEAYFEITRLRASKAELLAALKWCGEHTYAGGKYFAQISPVKEAIANAEKMT